MTAAIQTEKLTKSYGSHRGIIEVDLAIEEGEIFGFLGPNGAGKSTFIRLLLGFLHATSGGATVLGVFLGLSWPVAAVGAGLWLLIAATLRYSSLATLLATALAAASAWWLSPRPVAILATMLVLLVWAKHHENIRRLLAGTESRIGQKKSA